MAASWVTGMFPVLTHVLRGPGSVSSTSTSWPSSALPGFFYISLTVLCCIAMLPAQGMQGLVILSKLHSCIAQLLWHLFRNMQTLGNVRFLRLQPKRLDSDIGAASVLHAFCYDSAGLCCAVAFVRVNFLDTCIHVAATRTPHRTSIVHRHPCVRRIVLLHWCGWWQITRPSAVSVNKSNRSHECDHKHLNCMNSKCPAAAVVRLH
jgi:hypothetical protein